MNLIKTASSPTPTPFFILGCVRSGTTMLRNILRLHPHLACPEETHFYRWSEPFRGAGYRQIATSNPVLKKHRKLDGISEEEFVQMLDRATSRGDLYRLYMARYMALNTPTATRWFDKTPQNVYGAPLIATDFPKARFVHIVRDPVSVVASLRIGKVMKVDDLVAGCSYWNEAVSQLAVLKRAYPMRVLEIRYESFTHDPEAGIRQVLDFLDEPYEPQWFEKVRTSEVRHDADGTLTPEEMEQVQRLCLPGRVRHGYVDEGHAEAFKQARRAAREAQRALRKSKGSDAANDDRAD
jgi:hypothetical protein